MKPALLALTALCAVSLTARADEWNRHWSVNGTPDVHVTAGDAAITIEAGAASGVEANLTTQGWSIGDSGGLRVIEHQNGNRIDIDIKQPSTHFSFSLGNRSIKLVVRVPPNVTGNFHTGDGSVSMRGLHGSIRADTGDGSIQAEDMEGTLQAHSGDGSVHVRGRFDNLQIHTSDGSVDVSALRGSRMQSDWRLQTGDGSVRLGLPKDLAANLHLRTGDGSIHVNLDSVQHQSQEEHEIRAKLNGGGPALEVQTGDGSIALDSL